VTRSVGLNGDGWVRVSVPELPWKVEVLVRSVDGAPQILGLRLEPDVNENGALKPPWLVRDVAINTSSLRRLPLRRLRDAASAMTKLDLQMAMAPLHPALRKPGQPLPPGHLNEVSDVYRSAVGASQAPLRAIMHRWRVTRPTASRWVRAAREGGILGWPERIGVPGFKAVRPPTSGAP
jgi:hypothetical protein